MGSPNDWRLERYRAALERLPEDQRDVVMLRDLMNQPVAQIAQQLGRTERSVAGLLLRGRQKLRELLKDCEWWADAKGAKLG
jgi:RNA polymerase sigma-70 factor (ECF subfamily)